MKTIVAILIILLVLPFYANGAEEGTLEYREGIFTEEIFIVIIGFTVQRDMSVDGIRIVQVTDPQSGKPDPVDIPIPEQYMIIAKRLINNKGYEPTIENGIVKEAYTYFLYTPEYPNVVITKRKDKEE